jgi:Domain of unknown function (DUF1772)
MIVLEFVNLFCAGILAGIEFVVRYGIRGSITVLDEQPQIRLRQALIRRLRVAVPIVFASTALSAVAVTILAGTGFRYAGLLAVLSWTLVTFVGTVPINKATLTWQPAAPPANWRALVRRWERLDTARWWAAALVFALFLTAAAAS